jgi:hypothetical protein
MCQSDSEEERQKNEVPQSGPNDYLDEIASPIHFNTMRINGKEMNKR